MHNHWMQKFNEKRSLPSSHCCIKYKVYTFYSRVPSVASTSLATTPCKTVGARGPGAIVPPASGSQLTLSQSGEDQVVRNYKDSKDPARSCQHLNFGLTKGQ